MGLIPSPRHTQADLREWARLERYDRELAQSPRIRDRLDRLTKESRQIIEDFLNQGPAHVGVSWGRDSVVTAHLARPYGLPLVYITNKDRPDRLANPDCPLVCDAYLDRWPADYQEIAAPGIHPFRHVENHADEYGIPPRRVTGIRADESKMRNLSRAAHGPNTVMSCRPIIGWRSDDIWAYTALHGLPIHPAYAMSFGGMTPRDRLRVHSLGSTSRGVDYGRLEWENHYYPEVMTVRDPGRTPRTARRWAG